MLDNVVLQLPQIVLMILTLTPVLNSRQSSCVENVIPPPNPLSFDDHPFEVKTFDQVTDKRWNATIMEEFIFGQVSNDGLVNSSQAPDRPISVFINFSFRWQKRQIFQCLHLSLHQCVQSSAIELFCQNYWWCFLLGWIHDSVFSFLCTDIWW